MKIGDKTLNNFFEFFLLSFQFSIISSLPIVSINSQLNLSFRGVVTNAKLASVANT